MGHFSWVHRALVSDEILIFNLTVIKSHLLSSFVATDKAFQLAGLLFSYSQVGMKLELLWWAWDGDLVPVDVLWVGTVGMHGGSFLLWVLGFCGYVLLSVQSFRVGQFHLGQYLGCNRLSLEGQDLQQRSSGGPRKWRCIFQGGRLL